MYLSISSLQASVKKPTETSSQEGSSETIVRKFKRLPPKTVIHPLENPVADFPIKNQCFKYCTNECMLKASLLDSKEKEKMKDFQKQNTCDTKNNLLGYLWAQDSILMDDKEGFVFAGNLYCLKAFSKLTGVSEYLLRQVMDVFERGLKGEFCHEGRNSTKLHMKSINFIAWFQQFGKSFGQYAPDEQLITLPSFLTLKNIWQLYSEECSDPSHRVAYSTVVKLTQNHFGPSRHNKTLPRIRFSAHSTHSKCDVCSDLNIYQRSCKSQHEIDFVRALKYKHKQRYGCQRIQIEAHRNISERCPEDQMSVYTDGMDNYKGGRFQQAVKLYITAKCFVLSFNMLNTLAF